jgi:hypothetical protein
MTWSVAKFQLKTKKNVFDTLTGITYSEGVSEDLTKI